MGQVFIYITAVVVFAVVLIFGYKAITGFLDKGEQVAYVTFKTDLEKAVKNVYLDYGTVVTYNARNPMMVPSAYKRVCFIDLDYEGDKLHSGLCQLGSDDYHAVACGVWQSTHSWAEGDQNVFLEPLGMGPIKVYKIKMAEGYVCLPAVQGRIEMRLEGMGSYTLISKA